VAHARAQLSRDPLGRSKRTRLTAERVLELLSVLRSGGVEATLDGGWGVDALLGHETRPHEDLDLVVAFSDVSRIQEALRPLGFVLHEDHLPVRFVLRCNGEQLDFHTVTFDLEGGGVQPQPGGGSFRYPPEGFVMGRVRGESVPCISASVQVLCHLGYEPTLEDARDIVQLCHAFGLPIPTAYAHFSSTVRPDYSRRGPMVDSQLVALEVVTPDTARLLSNLFGLYLHDMSEIFPIEVGADGRFQYGKLPLYWSEPEKRFAFLIRSGARPAGFALVTRGSPATDDPDDLDVAEFFVLRGYRRTGVGRQAAFLLWNRLPGQWIVRVSEANRAGLPFWRAIIQEHTRGAFSESKHPGGPHGTRVFSFRSESPSAAV